MEKFGGQNYLQLPPKLAMVGGGGGNWRPLVNTFFAHKTTEK